MAEAGTVETPVLARTAKFAAVPSSTGAGPAAVAQRKAAYHDFDSFNLWQRWLHDKMYAPKARGIRC
jgi:hypothetical protein